jgi:uncharacterized protein
VQRITTGSDGDVHYSVGIKVTPDGIRAYIIGLGGLFDVQGMTIRIRINSHRLDAHFGTSAHNAYGDLAAVGYQYLLDQAKFPTILQIRAATVVAHAVLCTEWVTECQYGADPKISGKTFFDRSYNQLYDARPMSGSLPSNIDPIQLADQDTHLSGVIPLRQMKRLLTYCRSDKGDVSVELALSHDRERDVRMMRGEVATEITTTCERCLEPMTLALQYRVNLRLLMPGQENLEEQDDVLIVSEPVSLAELVENELILAMPMIPKHAMDQCAAAKVAGGSDSRSGSPEPEQIDSKESPFAGLAKLKRFDHE